MKKIALAALLIYSLSSYAQNKFLTADYWKAKPSAEQIKNDIAAGNSASEMNAGQFDAVTLAINNEAPFESIVDLMTLPGNPVNKITHDGRTYLHWAAAKNNTSLVDYLLKSGADLSIEDTGGRTPFQFGLAGAMKGETLQSFFNHGISPKYVDDEGANLALLTAWKDDTNLSNTKFLTKKGVNATAKDSFGRTIVDYAARSGNLELLNAFLAAGYKYTDQALLMAVQNRTLPEITFFQYLIEKLNISPKTVDANGKNILHYLAAREHSEVLLDYFLRAGVSPMKVDKEGANVLFYAARNKSVVNLQKMLTAESKQSLNTGNKDGVYPLMVAAQYSSPEMFKLLLENGATPQLQDRKGRTLLYYLLESYSARRENSISEIKQKLELLKERNYNFGTADEAGNTLLHLAAEKNNATLLEIALAYQPNVNVQNKEGETPLMINSMVTADSAILERLLAAGADKTIKNSLGETAFVLAQQNELLLKNNININFLQ